VVAQENRRPQIVKLTLTPRGAWAAAGRPKTDPATEKAIRAALSKGDEGMHKIAARYGVGTGTVQRIKAEERRDRLHPSK
jgi:hypothetical protein